MRRLLLSSVAVANLLSAGAAQREGNRPPNLVVVFVDDLGYGDIGPFGSDGNRTPNLDRMAREGMRLTSFYAAPLCTPSRASLLTGCYPRRVGLGRGSWHAVLMPGDSHGLRPDEVTIAEVLKGRGYATACIGKWHLGDQPEFLPTRQGFDEFFGLPYSNDMIPQRRPQDRDFPPLPLMRGEEVLREVTDQSTLTALYTREAVSFIERNKDRPFFLYLPHTMVHVPLHAGARFRGKSKNGILGDAIEEIDWSTGELLRTLARLGLDEHTLVLFTSDNGPARGTAGPLRGRKGSTFEGGMREPCIVRWPGRVPPGRTCDEITSTMDLLPTFAALAGAGLPADRKIDGGNIAPLLLGREGARSPHDAFYYYRGNHLRAVRAGPWKLHLPARSGRPSRLYHLGRDIAEAENLAPEHPDVVERLSRLAARARRELGDGGATGTGCRPVGVQARPRTIMPRKNGSRAPVSPAGGAGGRRAAGPAEKSPNVIVFLTDDQGYNDVGCYGSPDIETPNLDRMAAEGMRFTSFYAQNACGPSRAALMTGCYPMRCAEPGNRKYAHTVLHPREITIGEVLKQRGYRTACIGKWHLAGGGRGGRGAGPYDQRLMPLSQGFDEFFGTPSHNGTTRIVEKRITELHRGREVLEKNTDIDRLTTRYTEESVAFIRRNKDRPFFLYLAHTMPHVPLGVSEKFRGKSKRGLYGDVIMEIDWSMGRILATLKELELDTNTFVIFTSDNGPWIEQHLGDYGGSAHPLRGAKMTTWEGGLRVPCIMRWPGKIPAGKTTDEVVTTMDVLPTVAGRAGAVLPRRALDGVDAWPVISGQQSARSPRESFYYYGFTHLQAVRDREWKLVLPRPARPVWTYWYGRMIDAVAAPQLYRLGEDIGERHDRAAEHPEVVARMMQLVEAARRELGDYDRIGAGARFFDRGTPRPGVAQWAPRDPELEKPVGDLRFDFEDGTLQGWRVVEGEFDLVVSDRVSLPRFPDRPYRKQGKFHLSTIDRRGNGRTSDAMVGVIQSPLFELHGDEMSMLIGGGSGPATYVALCTPDGRELVKASGGNDPVMRRVRWKVSKFVGQKLVLRVVDRKKRRWAHVTFDDFSCDGKLVK